MGWLIIKKRMEHALLRTLGALIMIQTKNLKLKLNENETQELKELQANPVHDINNAIKLSRFLKRNMKKQRSSADNNAMTYLEKQIKMLRESSQFNNDTAN